MCRTNHRRGAVSTAVPSILITHASAQTAAERRRPASGLGQGQGRTVVTTTVRQSARHTRPAMSWRMSGKTGVYPASEDPRQATGIDARRSNRSWTNAPSWRLRSAIQDSSKTKKCSLQTSGWVVEHSERPQRSHSPQLCLSLRRAVHEPRSKCFLVFASADETRKIGVHSAMDFFSLNSSKPLGPNKHPPRDLFVTSSPKLWHKDDWFRSSSESAIWC